jgi:ferredoxin
MLALTSSSLEHVGRPVIVRIARPSIIRRLRPIPPLPKALRGRTLSHRGAWPALALDVPERLRTVPGIWRDPEAERQAYESAPLHDFISGNSRAITWLYTHMWSAIIPVAPRLLRARALIEQVEAEALLQNPRGPAVESSSLTAEVRRRAGEIGVSAVGVAPYDERYEFVEFRDRKVGETIIVCVLEQNYDSTQHCPSGRSERAALSGYEEIMTMASELARFLIGRGYRATVTGPEGQNITIHYAVEAGLGQLGLNGQLLTPLAGSRCRLLTINTNAPLERDHPVDYGIHGVCDACKACVRRCPVSAIPGRRQWYRGVLKSKLNTKRCLPIVAQANGCSICMKVCPVQKYGLPAVVEEFERTGMIKGRGTDDLEGFDWPLDGRHYAPGKLPKLSLQVREPPGVVIHTHPSGDENDVVGRLWS